MRNSNIPFERSKSSGVAGNIEGMIEMLDGKERAVEKLKEERSSSSLLTPVLDCKLPNQRDEIHSTCKKYITRPTILNIGQKTSIKLHKECLKVDEYHKSIRLGLPTYRRMSEEQEKPFQH